MFTPSKSVHPLALGVNPRDYHKLGVNFPRGDARRVMSRSDLRAFGECPSKWVRGHKEESTGSMDWGSLIDTLLLTPDRFDIDYAIAPEVYPCEPTKKDPRDEKPWNWNATYCADWRTTQESLGKEVVKSSTASEAWKAIARFREDEEIQSLLNASQKQVQACVDYHDADTGIIVPIKCLLDLAPNAASDWGTTLADLKTPADATSQGWKRTVITYGLHYQGAMYLDVFNAATGLKYKTWHHVIQESEAPYEVTLRMLSNDFLLIGRNEYESDLRRYCQCLKSNNWPGLSREIVEPEAWMLRE